MVADSSMRVYGHNNNIITKDMWMWRSGGGRAGIEAKVDGRQSTVRSDSCDVTAVCSITVNSGWVGDKEKRGVRLK